MNITDQELDKLLKVLSPTGIDYQAGRIVRLLAQGPNRTGIVASRCSVGNIPDVIAKSINPKIMRLGFFVSCVKPPMVIRNKFGQVAGDWIYTLNRADKSAANDTNGGTDGTRTRDPQESDTPELGSNTANGGTGGTRTRHPQGSTVEEWAKELEEVFDDDHEIDLSPLDDLTITEHDLAKVGAT